MKISVIIPVYNQEKYLIQAIESAMILPEVCEIIIVDDGSSDNSIEMVEREINDHSKIRILSHNNIQNLGVSATRNLGINSTKSDLIAFLDADDFYFSNRFQDTIRYFKEDSNLDVFFEPVMIIQDDKGEIFEDIKSNNLILFQNKNSQKTNFMNYFGHASKYGYWHLNGVTVNKRIFKKIDLFDISLRQTQDTDFILRLYNNNELKLDSQNVKSVAVRRIHNANRIHNTTESNISRYLLFKKWFNMIHNHNWMFSTKFFILKNLVHYTVFFKKVKPSVFNKIIIVFQLFCENPRIFLKIIT